MNTKAVITGLVGVTMACMAMSSCHWAHAETNNFNSPTGYLFQDYINYPPALRVNAAKVFNSGYYKDTDTYRIIKQAWGSEPAELYRWEVIQSQAKRGSIDLSVRPPVPFTNLLKFD